MSDQDVADDDFADFTKADVVALPEAPSPPPEDFADFEAFQDNVECHDAQEDQHEPIQISCIEQRLTSAFPPSLKEQQEESPPIQTFKDILTSNQVWTRVQNNPRNASTKLNWLTSKTFPRFVSSLRIDMTTVDVVTGLPIFASNLCLLEPIKVDRLSPIPRTSEPVVLMSKSPSADQLTTPQSNPQSLTNIDLDFLEEKSSHNNHCNPRPSDLSNLESELLGDLNVPSVNPVGPNVPPSFHSPLPLLHPVKNGLNASDGNDKNGSSINVQGSSSRMTGNKVAQTRDGLPILSFLRRSK